MKQSMKTYHEETLKQNQSEIFKQVIEASKGDEDEMLKKALEESKKEAEKMPVFDEEEMLRKVLEESKKEARENGIFSSIDTPKIEEKEGVPPVQQVVDMGYPMVLALQAYNSVGDNVPTMIDYIEKILN